MLRYLFAIIAAFSLVLGASGISVAQSNNCVGDSVYYQQWFAFAGDTASFPLPLSTASPGSNGNDWGMFTTHGTNEGNPGQETCDSGRDNCSGQDYTYGVANISTQWTAQIFIPWTGQIETILPQHATAFWDWYFGPGATRTGSSPDYSQNCHGFAFGVGDWPDDGVYGSQILLNADICYVWASEADATIAMRADYGHSLKVDGTECFGESDDFGPVEALTRTDEKMRDSAIYSRTGCCSAPIDLISAHVHDPPVGGWTLWKPNPNAP